jgi:hypothetical protein
MLCILFSGYYVAVERQRQADHETRFRCKRPQPYMPFLGPTCVYSGNDKPAELHITKKDRQCRSSFTEGENVTADKNGRAERHQHGVIVVIKGQSR